jgi:glycogen debranching enzyme GlgX/4-alpha-glucanotransferase
MIGMGVAETLGVSVMDGGINVAVYAEHAEAIAICLFDETDREVDRLRLPGRTGAVFHGHVPDVAVGTRYGLRAYGRWDPAGGHRFNPSKLLIDPWAMAIDRPLRLHPLLFDRDGPLPDDTAALVPKCIVGVPVSSSIPGGPQSGRPGFDWDRQILYELHVRGFTMTNPDIPPAIRGTFAGLGHPASIRHLTRLGVTTVELMPSAAWVDERHLPRLNLSNHWGYNPIAFLTPDPRLAPGGWAEVRAAVDALHAAGLNVVLDVVLNHTGESDELGPTLSLRGLDNAGYYRLAHGDSSRYANDAGCGNILAMDRPAPLRLGMDALRAWAVFGGLDGFRLDLAATLGRRDNGFDPTAPLLEAIEQDPLLTGRVVIAEPWDIGPGGYQLGAFPARWGEWNDRYRDTMRRFWRGDGHIAGEFATRLSGSADVFGPSHRPLSRSINFITAHDGFTLTDLVSYTAKHNAANGENNNDGTNDNLSWNNGAEGPTGDAAILANRARDVRALLATLLLSRGTPMLSMGDEAGRTQGGNNNAYAQDNPISWFDWSRADPAMIDFTTHAIALRRRLWPLFSGKPLLGSIPEDATVPDVAWLRPDGQAPTAADWNLDSAGTVIATLFAEGTRAVLVFHAAPVPTDIVLPTLRPNHRWHRLFDSNPPEHDTPMVIAARSVTVFLEAPEHADEADHTGEAATAGTGGEPLEAAEPAELHRQAPGASDAEVNRLADLAGIDPIWWDVDGGFHQVPVETKRALLAAMRLPASTREECRDSQVRLTQARTPPFPPVLTVRAGEVIRLAVGEPRAAWVTLLREDGRLERFQAGDGGVVLPPQPLGRHRLIREDHADPVCHLTVAPDGCYLPAPLAAGDRRFGIATHLYTLRRHGDQGIGDFTTLARCAEGAARSGAAILGLNPMHALFPHDRSRASPYQPSDRRFLDPIYIDVSGLPGGDESAAYPGPVDYPAVWDRKKAVLRRAFDTSDEAGTAAIPGSPESVPEALWRLATFEAIASVLGTSHWQQWPANLRHPVDPGVARFAAEHRDLVRFHVFLQTLADQQLAAAAEAAEKGGLSLGFYRDLAVGAAPDGAEAWSNQDYLMHGVSVGAPPDPFATSGQIWSLPPPDPIAMRRDGYASFHELLVANMRHAGALRIDHAMGLQRLFIVPDGATGADGAYINYPRGDLIAQVALQSQRSRCLVVGEDLGTVPEGMSAALAQANIPSYSVLWFVRTGATIRHSADWRSLAAACVSTHDLATLAGWWDGSDISEKHALGLLDNVAADMAWTARTQEKTMLLDLLRSEGLLSQEVDPRQPMPIAFAAAVHAFVCSTPALLALVQADDLAGATVGINLPGTNQERPNWRRRLDGDITELCSTPLARAILSAMRPRAVPA